MPVVFALAVADVEVSGVRVDAFSWQRDIMNSEKPCNECCGKLRH
jgi:hypothetical protein